MSGAAVPYHLRPHKAVDRRLFVDLLSRFERWRPLIDYVYLSMGAYALEDHKLIQRVLGLTRMIAFDLDDAIVARQKFNRPIETCHCIQKKSGDLISQLDGILSEFGWSTEQGVIVWLDYTNPAEIGQQIREFESLLDRLREGDVVRITVNAQPQAFFDKSATEEKPLLVEDKKARQFQKLKDRIGDYLPSGAGPEDMTDDGLARVLSEAFSAAALKALPVSNPNVFTPLSIIRYADGQQMLSVTGTIMRRDAERAMFDRLELSRWPFASTTWSTVHHLVVPHLTVRERLFLERSITSVVPEELIKQLGFDAAGDVRMKEFLDVYKDYYRFYPTLLAADV